MILPRQDSAKATGKVKSAVTGVSRLNATGSKLAGRTGTATSSSVLAEGSASSTLSWWQLFCVILGGVLALGVGIWALWRHRKKGNEEKKKREEAEVEERKRVLREVAQKKEEESGSEGSESASGSGSESYDSVSDGGTIRPKRRVKARGRERGRGRRRDNRKDESESESSDASSVEYDARKRGKRRGDRPTPSRRRREEDRRRKEQRRRDADRRREEQDRYNRNRRPPRRRERSLTPSPEPSPKPSPTPLPKPRSKARKRDTFRDSVFSSYGSMKKAAVRLKYVEAKVQLKKQLADEEQIEETRQKKIREANREIFKDRLKVEKGEDSAGSGHPLLIPPVARPVTQSSTGSSQRSTPNMPTPPPRARQQPHRQDSSDSSRQRPFNALSRPIPQGSSEPHPLRQNSAELGDEIHQLLGRPPTKPAPISRPPKAAQPAQKQASKVDNDFQADWLSHPNPSISMPASPGTGSVYVPVTQPKDRPTIPKGGLAPAPPPKVKSSPIVASPPSTGPEANKWADRLRTRR